MKKERMITVLLIMVFSACVFMLGGCSSGGISIMDIPISDTGYTVEDVYVIGNYAQMESYNDCLTCLGCVNMGKGCGGCDGSFYGFIDCFGITTSDGDTIEDYYSATNICGGCYYVKVPQVSSSGNIVPACGIMTINNN